MRYLTLSSSRHALVSLLTPSYLGSGFLPVSSCCLHSFPCCLFSCIWPRYNTTFLLPPHLPCSLLTASPSLSFKILSQILFSVWGSNTGASQLLTGDLSTVSVRSGFQLWSFLHQFCPSLMTQLLRMSSSENIYVSHMWSVMSCYFPTVTDLASFRQQCPFPIRKIPTF